MVMAPEALTFAMVSLDWAKVLLTSVVKMANASIFFFMKCSF
jgi:hypothetical protein